MATVTEQLLYECTGISYGGPDVVSLFDTVRLERSGPDRVSVRGVRGTPPGDWLKVSTNRIGGFRTSMTVPLTGLDIERKAALLQRQLAAALEAASEVTVTLARTDRADAATAEEASALLHFTVKDSDPAKVGRAFSGPVVASALSSIPGFFVTSPPGDAAPYGVYAPAWVQRDAVQEVVEIDGEPLQPEPRPAVTASSAPPRFTSRPMYDLSAPTRRVPLGVLAGARSGDKGGSCTLGVYSRTDSAFGWLADYLTVARLQVLLPEAAGLPITREELANVRAVLFQIPGLLGQGVAAATRFDPQAKAVGEWLRSRYVDAPVELLEDPASVGPGRPEQGRP